MRIGLDFDNTIISYDRVFCDLARERGMVPPDCGSSKTAVRDWLRRAGREDEWTALQGEVYGPRIGLAEPFPGVARFLARCAAAGVPVCVVSHKTRHPYRGPQHDLHAAALGWLEGRGFLAPGGGLARGDVYLEPTKAAKLARIGALGCTHFVDDLPEFLAEPEFPQAVRILFDPHGEHAGAGDVLRAGSWDQVGDLLLGPEARP